MVRSAAGVGQGVLYRHFPTRLDLAFAIFEDIVTKLAQAQEAGLADPGLTSHDVLLAQRMAHGVAVNSADDARARKALRERSH